ncbi:MAG: YceI family protein [Aureispira sp.]|nr:YceI family protein [Aureispira sp.]
MKNLFYLIICAPTLTLFSGCSNTLGIGSTNPSKWPEKAVGTLGFKAESPLYKANAVFRKWIFAKLSIPGDDITKLTATLYIDINSVYERTIRLTNDLKTEKYLDGVNYPIATVEISNVQNIDNDDYIADLKITIKEFTKKATTNFKLSKNGGTYHVKGQADLLRKEFDVGNDKMKSIKNEVVVYYDTDLK